MMDKNWKENIYNSIKDYSEVEKQKEAWLGLNKDFTSSFDEDLSLLFDSFCFEEFIDLWHKEGYDYSIGKELSNFKTMLESYKKLDSERKIIEDSKWLDIVNKAKKVISLWNPSWREQ